MHVARLARLADRAPLAVAVALPRREDGVCHDAEVPVKTLESDNASDAQRSSQEWERETRVVVKIRPRQLHYLVNGHLACVVRSHSPITAVDAIQLSGNEDVASSFKTPQLLVTTVDGDIWLITLPSSDQRTYRGGVASQLWLQRSAGALRLSSTAPSAGHSSLSAGITPTQFSNSLASQPGSKQAKLVYQVPGAVGIEHVQLVGAAVAVAVVRSVIAPTTVIANQWTVPADAESGEDDMEHDINIELDDLEGDQSSCSWSVHGNNKRFAELLASLFPEDAEHVQDTLFVIQGDADGCVRFATLPVPCEIERSDTLKLGRSGRLMESIGEPIAAIIPFSTVAASPATDNGCLPSCDALLVCGINGRLAIFSSAVSEANANHPAQSQVRRYQRLQLCHGFTIQSIAVVHILGVFVYCYQGSAFVCSCAELMLFANGQHGVVNASVALVVKSARKLPFPADLIRFAVDSSEDTVAIMFASGRVVSMEMATFSTVVASVLPIGPTLTSQGQAAAAATAGAEAGAEAGELPSREASTSRSCPGGNGGDEGRLRFLLEQIAQVSGRSADEQVQSLALDNHLEALHSALEVQRLVRIKGVDSVISCSTRASRAVCGAFADRNTVTLTCSVQLGKHSSVIQSLESWMIRVHLQAQHEDDRVATYTFPLQNSAEGSIGGDTSLVLDPEALQLDETAALTVTCELVFRPHINSSPVCRSGFDNEDESDFALVIPIGRPEQLLLIQLGETVNEHTSTTAASPARRSIEPSRYASRYASGDEKSSGHSVVQWWSALASHAESDDSFAGIWSKVTRVAAEQSPEEGRVFLTKLTSPSRFSMTIPSILPVTERAEPESSRVERMLQFLGRVLPTAEASMLRRNCRVVQGSKLWLTLRSLSGNLLLLKLQPQGRAGALSVVVQCSNSSELSAMRALLADAIMEMEAQVQRDPHAVNRACGRLSLVLGSHMDAIMDLEALVQELMEKVATSLDDTDGSSACTDEIIHAFAQLSSIEAQVLDIYWKTRRSLDKVNL